jgi:meso-butanediol dehydrogenase / (S,S)-butanediol dehydrogenase / diacetyl reductase
MMNTPLSIVTGAARGIGLCIARHLLGKGENVALLDIDWTELQAVQAQLQIQFPGQTEAHCCDVADPAAVSSVIDTIGLRHGYISGLVNNAGVAVFKPLQETSFEEWSRVMGVNLNGPFLCTQAATPWLLKPGPKAAAVVNIASISGLRASTLRVAYGTSKAALIHLSKQQAVELGALGIRVNAVSPGPVDTAMAKQVHSAGIRADYADNIPLGRYGEEAEIAACVAFLLSENASYVNGQMLASDGGFEASGIGIKDLSVRLKR